ncbi:MAG TPA: right-handed parallel beta-helix repeat-containing protein [Armatimonadota bacterium]
MSLRTTRWLGAGAVSLMIVALAPGARATTYVNRSNQNDPNSVAPRTIYSDTTWSPANGPYVIEDTVTITSSTRLTIQASAAVQVKPEEGIHVDGEIVAAGATFNRIGSSGHWLGIYLGPSSGASTLVNCSFTFTGSTTGYATPHGTQAAAIYVDRCNPIIQGCTFAQVADDSIELYDSNASVNTCVFQVPTVGHFCIYNDTAMCFPVVSGNAWTGLAQNGISVAPGTIYSGRWRKAGDNFPWIVRNQIFVQALMIDPGAQVQVAGSTILVEGQLTADGASANHIVFTAYGRPNAAGGNWNGILFDGGTVGTLNYCEIRYAGSSAGLGYPAASKTAAVYVNSGNVSITNSIIANSQTNGIEYASAAGQFGGGPQTSALKNNAFEAVAATYYAVKYDDPDCYCDVAGNSASGSGYLGIGVAGGEITTGPTWRKGGADFPYILRGQVTVGDQHVLNIAAGVRVEASNGAGITANGELNATGTALNPIVFTSGKASPVPGDFGGIDINSSGAISDVTYCHIEYSSSPALSVADVGTDVTYNTFLNPAGTCIQMSAATGNILNNTFTNVPIGQYAVTYDGPNVMPNIANNAATGPGYLGVKLSGGAMTASGTLQLPGSGLAYYLSSDLTVGTGQTAYFDPGNTFYIQGAGIYVNGVLHAIGAANARITFTSAKASPAPGDWEGIFIGATASGSEVEFSNVMYAGAAPNSGLAASCRADGSSPDFDHLAISHGLTHGILLNHSNSAVAACDFQDINGASYAVYLSSSDCFPMCNNDTASGSGHLGIRANPGTISNVNGFWRKPGPNFPWFLGGDFTVAANATLSIDPGVTVKMLNAGLYISGKIAASGSSSDRITFTSQAASPAGGDWKGIYIGPTAAFPSLGWLDIAYAGATLGTYHSAATKAALFLDDINTPIPNCRIAYSAYNGIELYSSDAPIRNCLLDHNAYAGVLASSGSNPDIYNCTIGNGAYGVVFTDSAPDITNSIIYNTAIGISKGGATNANVSHNDLYANGGSYAGMPDQTGLNGNTTADPLFANFAAGNFRLSYGSPCINTGANSAVAAGNTDLDGAARIQAATVDKGAYEYPAIVSFTLADVEKALGISAGVQAAAPSDLARLNVASQGDSAGEVDTADAIALARKVAGADPNP